MLADYIEKLNPKPIFNLKWYKNEDLYSEGDIEDKIIEMIADNNPEDYVEAIYKMFNWSTYYHLSHIRRNILNWYPFDKDSDILEIGCGLGAITGMLCDNAKSVTAVELSKRRATATLLRCREKSNLEIIVGNLNDIEFEKQYDYITLIGVLEYQGDYTNTENPYHDFLVKIRSLLKPTGKLLIAIENQFGLKYWCGAREDHTSLPFDGINGYTLSKRKVRTFSRKSLETLVKESGFKHTFFYYPMPDYKLPTVVYSDNCLPTNSNMQNMNPYYYPDAKTLIADERELWKDVIENNTFPFFANSFLVECSDDEITEHVTFASMSTARLPEYRIGTKFVEKNRVQKFATEHLSRSHLKTIKQNEAELSQNGIQVLSGKQSEDELVYDFIKEQLLEDRVLNLLKNKKTKEFEDLLTAIYNDILKSSEKVDGNENIIFTFGLRVPSDVQLYGPILRKAYLDMILRNAFITEKGIVWFDQEWTLENAPASFVMYRLLKEFWSSYPFVENSISLKHIASKFGLIELWKTYDQIESLFMGAVIDQKFLNESMAFCIK